MTVGVHEFLREHRAEIIRSWEALVLDEVREVELVGLALRDHVPSFLDELAAWLESGAPAGSAELAGEALKHVLQRLDEGLGLPQVLREYRLLRQAIHAVVLAAERAEQRRAGSSGDAGWTARVEDLARLNAGLDVALSDSIAQFVAERERTLRETIARVSLAERASRDSEESARARAAELETVLDTVPAAVWISRDPRGDRIDANRFGAELLRRRPGENVSVTAPGADRPRHFVPRRGGVDLREDELPIQRAARLGEEIHDAEFDLHFDDGEIRHLLGNSAPLRDGTGRVKGSVGAFIDITERKAAEEALRESDRRKTAFLAVLSHELRNPLAPIRNSVMLLETAAPGSATAVRAQEILRRQTEQLTRLVDDLLDLSRITHGKIEMQLAILDARDVVARACADAKPLFEERGVGLQLTEMASPLWVSADAARLSQMLGNLLSNALKFTPPHGAVRVEAQARHGACEISVRDTGIGLDTSELDRIFDPFVQAERTRAGQGGLGLGLALVRELAEMQGGTVHARSEGAGRGSEFVLRLPSSSAALATSAVASAGSAGDGLAVLIVDDNEDSASTLADLLSLGGNRVTTALTGKAGVNAVADVRPDVLICDIGLPDMSGHDVIRTIRAREDGHRVFAMALSGYAQPQDREHAIAAGFDAHLAKPPRLEELEALLAEVARRRRAAGGQDSTSRGA